MADPILFTKAAVMALNSDKFRKGIGWTVVAILSPIIVIIALLLGILSGAANHNSMALNLSFNGGVIAGNVPEEYRVHIEDMRNSFTLLDGTIALVNVMMENENSIDSVKIKAIFYSLYFGADRPSMIDSIKFVYCFVIYNEHTSTVINDDGTTSEETYKVAIPIKEMSVIYENISSAMGITATIENKSNATEIYYRILYGRPAPTYGQEFDDFINGLPVLDTPFIGENGFCSPIGENWRGVVTSEFGYRNDPFTGKISDHSGIDLGMPKGTPVRSVLDGTVMLVRYSTTGYGYHVIVDHGGGFVTLYAHCSKILVSEGEKVKV
ncbi:MAG TPA: M23 family peptidase, partial [Clostridiales bacterium]|nr:M23 family peptidase [Clostridiales bacterium]